jgi:hypothetical protein
MSSLWKLRFLPLIAASNLPQSTELLLPETDYEENLMALSHQVLAITDVVETEFRRRRGSQT